MSRTGRTLTEFGDTAELLFTTNTPSAPAATTSGCASAVPFPNASSQSEVLSRGVPVGAIEVPSREELLVLHRGRGVTAGYPVLAVVTSRSLDVLAQARPGHTITFSKTTVPEATAKHRTACLELDRLRNTINTVFGLLGIGAGQRWHELSPASGA